MSPKELKDCREGKPHSAENKWQQAVYVSIFSEDHKCHRHLDKEGVSNTGWSEPEESSEVTGFSKWLYK